MSLDADEQARVLAAAARLGGADGAAFTMAQLARTAGMSRATLYRRFGGRARLAAALRERGAAAPTLRERLLGATLELLGERGPLGFSLEDVAARAGASVTTIYRMFGERDELLRAAISTMSPHAALQSLLADADAPLRPTLEAFVAAAIGRFEAQPIFLRILFMQDAAALRTMDRLRAREVRLSRVVREYFAAQIERGRVRGAAVQLGASLVGQILGDVLMRRRAGDDLQPAAARARTLVAQFLDGVGVRTRRRS